MASMTAAATPGGAIALLNLPPQSIFGVDGHTLVLERDDFVGIVSVPSDDALHLVAVRGGSGAPSTAEAHTLTLGFVLIPNRQTDWIFARRYDSQTEEVSSTPVDDVTCSNVLHQIRQGRIEPQRAIPYQRILSAMQIDTWKQQTNFISAHLIHKRGFRHGDKIVPGAYEDPEAENFASATQAVDGKHMDYPPIPFLNNSIKFKRTSHLGAKRYLAHLSPADRTALFLDDNPADRALSDVLSRYYDKQWQDLLGDVQLSFTLFLNIHCLSSLEHWRDLIAMTSTVDSQQVAKDVELYSNLLKVLTNQVTAMEPDFFEDIEYSEDNFFVPAVKRLCSTCSLVMDDRIAVPLSTFTDTLSQRFPNLILRNDENKLLTDHERNGESDLNVNHDVSVKGVKQIGGTDDDEGPLVVPSDEVEASLARSNEKTHSAFSAMDLDYTDHDRDTYRLLFAAKMEHEDILMTCARILDAANDVSLVREAAAYLEEVEAKRKC